jgi:NADPH:quinone reductase-like Zn-dependent oxidoreductase
VSLYILRLAVALVMSSHRQALPRHQSPTLSATPGTRVGYSSSRFRRGKLEAIFVQTFPLVEAAEAHRAISDRKTIGKVVLLM